MWSRYHTSVHIQCRVEYVVKAFIGVHVLWSGYHTSIYIQYRVEYIKACLLEISTGYKVAVWPEVSFWSCVGALVRYTSVCGEHSIPYYVVYFTNAGNMWVCWYKKIYLKGNSRIKIKKLRIFFFVTYVLYGRTWPVCESVYSWRKTDEFSEGTSLRGGVRSTGVFPNYCFKYCVRFDGVFVIYLVIYACFFIDVKPLHSFH
jgi:hypothetical protein